jgi:hypothetical protein
VAIDAVRKLARDMEGCHGAGRSCIFVGVSGVSRLAAGTPLARDASFSCEGPDSKAEVLNVRSRAGE